MLVVLVFCALCLMPMQPRSYHFDDVPSSDMNFRKHNARLLQVCPRMCSLLAPLCIVVMMHHYDFGWSLCMKALMAQIPKPAHVDDSGVPYADDAKFQCPTAE